MSRGIAKNAAIHFALVAALTGCASQWVKKPEPGVTVITASSPAKSSRNNAGSEPVTLSLPPGGLKSNKGFVEPVEGTAEFQCAP